MRSTWNQSIAVGWGELIRTNLVVVEVLKELQYRSPSSYEDKDGLEQSALRAARSQGYRDAMEMLQSMSGERDGSEDSPFMDSK